MIRPVLSMSFYQKQGTGQSFKGLPYRQMCGIAQDDKIRQKDIQIARKKQIQINFNTIDEIMDDFFDSSVEEQAKYQTMKDLRYFEKIKLNLKLVNQLIDNMRSIPLLFNPYLNKMSRIELNDNDLHYQFEAFESQIHSFSRSQSFLLEMTENVIKNPDIISEENQLFDKLELSISECLKQNSYPNQIHQLLHICNSLIQVNRHLYDRVNQTIHNNQQKNKQTIETKFQQKIKQKINIVSQLQLLLKEYKDQLKQIKQQRKYDKILINQLQQELKILKNDQIILINRNNILENNLKKIETKHKAQNILYNSKMEKLIENTIVKSSSNQLKLYCEHSGKNNESPKLNNYISDYTSSKRQRFITTNQGIMSPQYLTNAAQVIPHINKIDTQELKPTIKRPLTELNFLSESNRSPIYEPKLIDSLSSHRYRQFDNHYKKNN